MNMAKQGYVLIFIIFFFSGCHQQNTPKPNIFTVQSQSLVIPLFYMGVIQPLKTINVLSPAEGIIVEAPFQYGEWINQGQLMFKIDSIKFLADYKAALMQYIKAKNEFDSITTQWKESQFLYQHELISADEYKNRQSNFYVNRLALFQAKEGLNKFIKQFNIQENIIYQLSIADLDKIIAAIHLKKNAENLSVIAPSSGVILSASKNQDEGENKKLLVGGAIKEGEVLALIGNMQGIGIKIKVSELTVNQLQIGQKVKVTGIAFPDTLTGKIVRIDRQGEVNSAQLSLFTAEVIVPRLTKQQQQIIHAGMSAKIEIDIEEPPQIIIPLSAIKEKNNRYYVLRINNANQQLETIEIKTGKTTSKQIVIVAGLKLGDRIVA